MALAILCGHGHMNYNDMVKECQEENWLPVLVLRTKDMPADSPPIVPIFQSEQVAAGFIRRNLPKDWLCGTIKITLRDASWMDDKGWRALEFTFPRKMKDVVNFDVEVLECTDVCLQRKRAG